MNNTTLILNQTIDTDNSLGAIIFIIIVLLWYSSSIVFLLGMQIGTSNKSSDDSIKHPSQLFDQSLRDQTNNKEILKELVDKQKRDKLWDIYLGKSTDMNDKISRDEINRIRNIEKQLATLNDHNRRVSGDHSNSSLWSSVTDLSSLNSRLRIRRRSSLDNKILQKWKMLGDELKTHENWPWAIQKLLIRRHLRRQRLASECQSAP